jgi:GDP-6-deoxy-D-talose 4-dehydrogenase
MVDGELRRKAFRSDEGIMKKVLITGVKGFTGKYVAAELEAHGWQVWGIGKHEQPEDPQYRCVDLCDSAEIRQMVHDLQPDAVIHLAAVAFVGHGHSNAFYEINLIGTRNLLEGLATCEKKPECIILASSATIYGNATEGMLKETHTPNPANDYAVSKLAMEYMARLWCNMLPIVITRPFNYSGVGQTENFVLPKIVAHFRSKAASVELGNLDVWRDFSDVRAVAKAYRRLLEVRPVGETVNVCSGKMRSLREALSIAEAISGYTLRVLVNPAYVRENEVKTLSGDPSKLIRLIGDWDTPSLEETMSWMLRADET